MHYFNPSDIVVSALRNTHLQFNFSLYPTCPRLRRYQADAAPRLPLHYDAMVSFFIRLGLQTRVRFT